MYKAHISEDKTRSQSVVQHLQGTQKLAGDLPRHLIAGNGGTAVGSFMTLANTQPALNGESMKGDRSRTMPQPEQRNYITGEMFLAHIVFQVITPVCWTGGTVGDSAGEATLMGRMKKRLDDYSAFQHEVEIPAFPLRF